MQVIWKRAKAQTFTFSNIDNGKYVRNHIHIIAMKGPHTICITNDIEGTRTLKTITTVFIERLELFVWRDSQWFTDETVKKHKSQKLRRICTMDKCSELFSEACLLKAFKYRILSKYFNFFD